MGECFFWYRPTRVVPDQRPLNGRCLYLDATLRVGGSEEKEEGNATNRDFKCIF